MSTTPIAIATARELKDRWAKEVYATLPYITESSDSSGNPVLTLSADATPATGEKVVVVRVKPISMASMLNVLGSTQEVFSPHVIQICTEANYAATTDNVADILTPAELGPVIIACGRKGMTVEWYVSANGTVPATTQMTSSNLKVTVQGNMYQGYVAGI